MRPDQGAIIGLVGLAGSGKTRMAQALEDRFHFVRLPFAGPIKDMARAFGLLSSEVSGILKEEPCIALCGKTPRQFMQWLGTEFGRDLIGEDVWINAWRRRLERHVAEALEDGAPLRIVCDDVRFANEAAAIRGLGGVVLRLSRQGAGSASGGAHPSESQPLSVDREIGNDGEVDHCLAQILASLD